MKKTILAAGCALVMAAMLLPARAEAKDCWYLETNGVHDFEQTDAGDATCTEDGYYVIECRQCGYYIRQVVMEATGHDWTVTHQEEPSDCSYGIIIQECNWCNASKSQKVYPDGTLMRGSKDSDGVKELQMMLIDCGYLNDSMDGIFGKNTESAVKAFQKADGLNADGIAWPQTLERLEMEWTRRQGYVEQYPAASYAPFCYTWENEDGLMVMVHCRKHALLWSATQVMLAGGDADSALYSYYEWQAEIISLYNVWIELVNEPVRAQIEASKQLCIQMMELQKDAMFASYQANGTEIDPSDIYYGAELWMRTHAAWLCQMISTLEAV